MRSAPLALVIPAMVLPFICALLYFVAFAGHPLVPWIYGASKVLMIAWPLVVTWRYGRARLVAPRAWPVTAGMSAPSSMPWSRWRIIAEGLLLGLTMAGGILALAFGPLAPLLAAAAPRMALKVADFHIAEPLPYLIASLVISVVHSAFEEFYWRWFVYGQLQTRMRDGWAHALTGAAFAAHHCVIAAGYCGVTQGIALGLVVGLAGACWSLLYRRHATLLGAWIAHACCDLALMYLGWLALHPNAG